MLAMLIAHHFASKKRDRPYTSSISCSLGAGRILIFLSKKQFWGAKAGRSRTSQVLTALVFFYGDESFLEMLLAIKSAY